MATLGSRIRLVRKLCGLNQADFARRIQLEDKSTVSKYEKDQREPTIATLATIAHVGNVSVGWLISGIVVSRTCKAIAGRINETRIRDYVIERTGVSDEYLLAIAKSEIMPSEGVVAAFCNISGSDLNSLEIFKNDFMGSTALLEERILTQSTSAQVKKAFEIAEGKLIDEIIVLLSNDIPIQTSIYKILRARKMERDALSEIKDFPIGPSSGTKRILPKTGKHRTR